MKKFVILSIAIGVILWSCKKNSLQSLAYTNCCDNPPFEATIGKQKISIANVFTPNFDGINDCVVLQTASDTPVITITNVVIQGSLNQIVWKSNSQRLTNQMCLPFSEQDLNNMPEGRLTIRFKATAPSGETGTFTAQVCKNGTMTNHCPSQNTNCVFPSQYDATQSQFNKMLPTSENCK